MHTFGRTLVAFYTALLPFIGFNLVNLFIINDYPNLVAAIICTAIFISSIFLSRYIFLRVRNMGYINFMYRIEASPDFDDPEVTEDSRHQLRKAVNLPYFFDKKENVFKGGSIGIYGDYFGSYMDDYRELKGYQYFAYDKRLVIFFNDNLSIEVYRPEVIIEADTYLKIKRASKIKLLNGPKENVQYIEYFLDPKSQKFETDSNFKEQKHMELSPASPALMIH